jgi:hypothetical protein
MADEVVDVIDVAVLVASAIESVGGEYFVGGSVASSLQGDPRATNDIDFVISLPLGKIGALRDALGPDFEVDIDTLRDALLHASCANVFYLPFVTKVDFFGRSYEPFDESEFARRKPILIDDNRSLVLKTPEDTVLRKLLWYRQGGEVSDRQWRDIRSVLRVSGDRMDATYMTSWAARLGVTELLARAMAE